MTLAEKLFSFHGRLRRRDYWLLSLGLGVAAVILLVGLTLALGGELGNDDDLGYLLAQVIMGAVLIWPSLAIAVKRLHDRDQSGWWYLIAIIPLIGSLWVFINLGILDGTAGRNQFGPSPKYGDHDTSEVFA